MHLIGKGFKDVRWLDECSVTNRVIPVLRRGNLKKTAKEGTVHMVSGTSNEDAKDGSSVFLEVIFNDGTKEKVTFNDIMHYLYAPVLRKRKGNKIKVWPKIVEPKKREPEVESDEEEEKKPKKKTKKHVYNPDDWDMTKDEKEETTKKPDLPEIHISLANVLCRTLNTPEPMIGADLIGSALLANGHGMNSFLGRNLLDLLLDGPKSERKAFPDPNRVELAFQVVEQIRGRPQFMMSCVENCCPKTWETFTDYTQRMSTQSYCPVTDDSSSKKTNYERVADSLHLSARAAEFLAGMFVSELVGLVSDGKEHTSGGCQATSLGCVLLNHEKGIRGSTEAVMDLYSSAWQEFGYLVVGAVDGADETVLSRCRAMARLYLHQLARITRWTLWITMTINNGRGKENRCAEMMKDSWKRNDSSILLSHKDRQLLKLQAVLALNNEIDSSIRNPIEQIQQRLAEKLSIGEYKILV